MIFFIARHWLEVRTVQGLKPCNVLRSVTVLSSIKGQSVTGGN